MLFWLFVAIVIIGAVCMYLYENTNIGEWAHYVGLIILAVGIIAVLISLVVFSTSYIGVDAYIAENNMRYDSLVYQYENDLYDNDNDLGKKELMKEIQDWNEDLAYYRAIQDDFWVGIYVPDVFNQFNFIELK